MTERPKTDPRPAPQSVPHTVPLPLPSPGDGKTIKKSDVSPDIVTLIDRPERR